MLRTGQTQYAGSHSDPQKRNRPPLEGRKDQIAGGLSPRSVRYIHTIIHRAFKDAVKWGRLVRNPPTRLIRHV
jgi:hypothetical protein